jgi:mannosyltransferase
MPPAPSLIGWGLTAALGLFHVGWLALAQSRRGRPAARPWQPLWRFPPVDPWDAGPLRREMLLLGLVLALALVLRLVALNAQLWIDEVFTLVNWVREPLGYVLTHYDTDNEHLLYTLLAQGLVRLFGESPEVLRIPALLFGLASIWATWRLARRLAGPRQALLAAGLLAVSYHHVWFSQDARGYTGLLFAAILSTDALLRWLDGGRWPDGITVAVATAVGFGIHLTMLFVTAGQGLVVLGLLLYERIPARRLPSVLWPFLLGATLTLQLYAGVLPSLVAFFLHHPSASTPLPVAWKKPAWLVAELLRGLHVSFALGVLGFAAALTAAAAGGLAALRRAPAAIALYALPALLGGATMIGLGRNLWPRFFFFELGFAALVLVQGVYAVAARLASWWRPAWAPRAGVACASAILCVSAMTLPRNYRLPKQDFRGALAWVEAHRQPGDAVVGVDLAGKMYHLYFAPEMPVVEDAPELDALRGEAPRVWVIYTLGGYLHSAHPELWEDLQRNFESDAVFPGTLGGGEIVVLRECRRPGGWPTALRGEACRSARSDGASPRGEAPGDPASARPR